MQLKSRLVRPTVHDRSLRPKRLGWLEAMRIIAAMVILIYHAQLYFSHYAFTPQPTGLWANLNQLINTNPDFPLLLRLILTPCWFGFQFVDVFVLISGFSLVLSLNNQPLQPGPFLKRRLLRLLIPFWAVAWLSFPVLWAIGQLTHSYRPDGWHVFLSLTFPLTFDYRGSGLLPINGPWWFMPLILSFTLAFPVLWHLSRRWGMRSLVWCSLGVTIAYRALAIYAFGGHPTYALIEGPYGEAPFQVFFAKLSTFVIGMAIAQAYQQGRGPLFWRQRRVLWVGSNLYIVGWMSQFYQPGWIAADLLVAPGLFLLGMLLTRQLNQWSSIQPVLLSLGACSYTYFLLHDFVVSRTLELIVQADSQRYLLLLPLMIGLTLGLALGVNAIIPRLQQGVLQIWQVLDRRLQRTVVRNELN